MVHHGTRRTSLSTDTGIFFANFAKKSRYPLGSVSVLLVPCSDIYDHLEKWTLFLNTDSWNRDNDGFNGYRDFLCQFCKEIPVSVGVGIRSCSTSLETATDLISNCHLCADL